MPELGPDGTVARRLITFSLVVSGLLGIPLGAHALLAVHSPLHRLTPPLVWVHGDAQLFGFALAFVAGLTLLALPRPRAPFDRVAPLALPLITSGVVFRITGRFAGAGAAATAAAIAGCALLALAILVLAAVSAAALHGAPLDRRGRFVVAGTAWWVVAAALLAGGAFESWRLGTPAALVLTAAPLQAAVLSGGALLSLAGLVLEPSIEPWPPAMHVAFAAGQVGAVLSVGGAAGQGRASTAAALGLLATAIAVAAIVLSVVRARRRPGGLAMVLALVGAVAFAARAVHVALAEGPATALAQDGVRHALAVGVVALPAFAIAARVVPERLGRPLRARRALELGLGLQALALILRDATIVAEALDAEWRATAGGASAGAAGVGFLLSAGALLATLLSSGQPARAGTEATP